MALYRVQSGRLIFLGAKLLPWETLVAYSSFLPFAFFLYRFLSSTLAFSHCTICETVEIGQILRIIFECRVENVMFKN